MRIKITVETQSGETGAERNYVYEIELSETTSFEVVEAHVSNVARLLDRQASEALDEDDDKDDWMATP